MFCNGIFTINWYNTLDIIYQFRQLSRPALRNGYHAIIRWLLSADLENRPWCYLIVSSHSGKAGIWPSHADDIDKTGDRGYSRIDWKFQLKLNCMYQIPFNSHDRQNGLRKPVSFVVTYQLHENLNVIQFVAF